MAPGTFQRNRALLLIGLALGPPSWPQALPQVVPHEDSRSKAWDILWAGAHASSFDKRANAVQALGLTAGDFAAVGLAEDALADREANVRAAAAKALGAMSSTASIPKLQNAMSDKDISVVLAIAHSLVQLKDNSGYDAYYSVLEGERKCGKGLGAQPIDLLMFNGTVEPVEEP